MPAWLVSLVQNRYACASSKVAVLVPQSVEPSSSASLTQGEVLCSLFVGETLMYSSPCSACLQITPSNQQVNSLLFRPQWSFFFSGRNLFIHHLLKQLLLFDKMDGEVLLESLQRWRLWWCIVLRLLSWVGSRGRNLKRSEVVALMNANGWVQGDRGCRVKWMWQCSS